MYDSNFNMRKTFYEQSQDFSNTHHRKELLDDLKAVDDKLEKICEEINKLSRFVKFLINHLETSL